jgi:hypothetical protein
MKLKHVCDGFFCAAWGLVKGAKNKGVLGKTVGSTWFFGGVVVVFCVVELVRRMGSF